MVATPLPRALLLAISLCTLGSCGFFSVTTFPVAASQLAAQKDLSADIPAVFSGTFTLSTVTVGGMDFVFLASYAPYDGPHLIVMDRDLNVLQKVSYADLVLLSAQFSNTGAFLDASGSVVILGLQCVAGPTGLAGFLPISFFSNQGLTSFTDGTYNYTAINASGNQMSYQLYDSGWSGTGISPFPISSNSSANFNLVGVYEDRARADVVFILEENSSGLDYYVLVSESTLPGILSSPNLLANYPYFTAPRADNRLTAYSQNGFISFQRTYNGPGGTFIRLDTFGHTLSDSLRYTDTTDIQLATRTAGGWYYVFNRTTCIMTKIKAWWGQ